MKNEERQSLLMDWIQKNLAKNFRLDPIPGDASFRRYFRITTQSGSLIAMDAPPESENIRPFIAVAKGLSKQGLCVPEIVAFDDAMGFMLLSDLGDDQYFRIMAKSDVKILYQQAMEALSQLQDCREFPAWELPDYDERLLGNELELFRQWYLQRHLGLILTQTEHDLIDDAFRLLIISARSQPQVCVHRDYHSRNLLDLPHKKVGILDFQDAVLGPITYDIVSLLRDCYIAWPQSFIKEQLMKYYQLLCEKNKMGAIDSEQLLQWFDWVGLQRHLKVLGIFSRLYHRDGKEIYLKDLPRVMSYVMFVCQQYTELADFLRFIELRVLPNESNDFSSRTGEAYATLDR